MAIYAGRRSFSAFIYVHLKCLRPSTNVKPDPKWWHKRSERLPEIKQKEERIRKLLSMITIMGTLVLFCCDHIEKFSLLLLLLF